MWVWVVVAIVVALIVLSFLRLWWRMRNEQLEPGGSDGSQWFSGLRIRKRRGDTE